jgi:hypothetical protein
VNISDRSGSAFFAKVDSTGALKTTAVVSGKVAPALPPQPFYVQSFFNNTSQYAKALGPTTATVALTDVTVGNYFPNQARGLWLAQWSAPAPNTTCTNSRERLLGRYDVASAQTVHASFQTPPVVKPLASGDAWCLMGNLVGPNDPNDYSVNLSLGGYVLSGTFTPPAAAEPAELRAPMRRR